MKMRIVGMNNDSIFIQTNNKNEWIQKVLSFDDFESFMKENFPEYWKKFVFSSSNIPVNEYFYNYNETPLMRKKGIAYIFE